MDVNNFDIFTETEYLNNLKRLNITSHSSLIGKKVFYVKKSYGEHIVENWNPDTGEYLLNLDGQKFYTNPFKIHITH